MGKLNITIDELVSCLVDNETNEEKKTVVEKVINRSSLKGFNKKNGWYINWYRVYSKAEIYALKLKENDEVQGLVAVVNDEEAKAAYISWACTAPHNNKHDYGKQKYRGVGGHLFAVAADKSEEWGYGGLLYGYAANKKLLEHYIDKLGAEYIGITHEYQFIVSETEARNLLEVYDYERK